MTTMKLLVALLLSLCGLVAGDDIAPLNNKEDGKTYCTEGYIMDTYCILRGTLLDRPSLKSLEHPERHSIHCLVDVNSCVASGYEVLVEDTDSPGNYLRDVKLDSTGTNLVLSNARRVGSCSTCMKGGTQLEGFRATVFGKIVLGSSTDEPPLLMVTKMEVGTSCPAPASGGGFTVCFPGDMTVDVENQGVTKMRDLKLGDKVKTFDAQYETVYAIPHKEATMFGQYIQLKTASHVIELSPSHMIFVQNRGIIPASLVHVGDKLKTVHDSHDEVVQSVVTVLRQGMYAPFTPSGGILVNGVKVSNYVALQESPVLQIGGFETLFTHHWLAHTFQAPHRLYCSLRDCKAESYNDNGIARWVEMPLKLAVWVFHQPAVIQWMILVPFVLMLGLFALLEVVLSSKIMLCGTVAASLAYPAYRSGKVKQI